MDPSEQSLLLTSLDDVSISEQFRGREAVFRMSDSDSVSSERSYIVVRGKIRTNEEVLQDLYADVDISDGEYDSDCSVGVDIDTDDEFGYSSQSNTNSPDQKSLLIAGTRMALSRMDSNTDMSKMEVNKIFTSPINKQNVGSPNESAGPTANPSSDESLDSVEEMIREEIRLMEEETAKKRNELKEMLKLTDQPNNNGRKSRTTRVVVQPTERTCIGTKSDPQVPILNNIRDQNLATSSKSYNMAKTSAHAIKPTRVIKPVFSGNMVQPTYHPQRTHTPAFNKSYKGKHLDNARKIDETIRQANCDDSLPGKSTTIFHQADLAAHDHRPMPEVGLDSHSAAPSVNGTPVEGVLTGNKHVRFRIDRPFEQPSNLPNRPTDPRERRGSQSLENQASAQNTTEQEINKRGVFKSIRKQLSRFGRFIRRKLKRNTTVSPNNSSSI